MGEREAVESFLLTNSGTKWRKKETAGGYENSRAARSEGGSHGHTGFTRPAGICLTSLKWHEATFLRRCGSSPKIMDCEHKTSSLAPFASIPCLTHTPLSTLPEAAVLIPRSPFTVTFGCGLGCRRSFAARLTFCSCRTVCFLLGLTVGVRASCFVTWLFG